MKVTLQLDSEPEAALSDHGGTLGLGQNEDCRSATAGLSPVAVLASPSVEPQKRYRCVENKREIEVGVFTRRCAGYV